MILLNREETIENILKAHGYKRPLLLRAFNKFVTKIIPNIMNHIHNLKILVIDHNMDITDINMYIRSEYLYKNYKQSFYNDDYYSYYKESLINKNWINRLE